MAGLRDFIPSSEDDATIEEFIIDIPRTSVMNFASVSNIAAKAAALSGNDLVNVYDQVTLEMESGDSPTADAILEKAEVRARVENQRVIIDLLSGSSLDEVNRVALATKWAYNVDKKINLNSILVRDAITSDSSPYATVEQDDVRGRSARLFSEARAHIQFMQNIINKDAATSSTETMSLVADFIELVIPFDETALTLNILDKLRSKFPGEMKSGSMWLGDNRAIIRDWIKKMPPERMEQIGPLLAAIVKSNSTAIYSDTNDLFRMESIRLMLQPGGYSSTAQRIDNIVSVLDWLVVGTGIRVFRKLKSVKGLGKGYQAEEVFGIDPDKFTGGKPKGGPQRPVGGPTEASEDLSRIGSSVETKATSNALVPLEEVHIIGKGPEVVKPIILEAPKDVKVPIGSRASETLDPQLLLEHTRLTAGKTKTQPSTVSQLYKTANPQTGRAIHAAVVSDATNKTARATYGTIRPDALADDLLGEPLSKSGYMRAKLSEPDAIIAQSEMLEQGIDTIADIERYLKSEQAAIYYFDSEKAVANTVVMNAFHLTNKQNVTGLTARKEMFQFAVLADGSIMRGVYGPPDAGFLKADDAMIAAKIHFAEYGIKDENLHLLVDKGGIYVPVKKGEATPDADYLIQVDYRHKFTDRDIIFNGGLDAKWNWLDSIPALRSGKDGIGSAASHALDAAAMLNPLITQSAFYQVDKSSVLLNLLAKTVAEFDKKYKSLTSNQQLQLTSFFKEANGKFDIDDHEMFLRQFTDTQKELGNDWRRLQDTLYHLEDDDLRKTLKAQGYWLFQMEGNTNLIAKPLKNPKEGATVYDPVTGTIDTRDMEFIEKLYNSGGTLATLKTPVEIEGVMVDKLIVHNSSNSYIRALADSDIVLNKVKGYYSIHYTDPWFIEHRIIINGKKRWVAKFTARNQKIADSHVTRMNTGGELYRARLDRTQTTQHGDSAWETIVFSGRSSQRIRGEQLGGGDGSQHIENAPLMDPSEAVSRSIASASRKLEMRPWFDATKARLMSVAEDVMPKEGGIVVYPQYGKQISADNIERSDHGKSLPQLNREARNASTLFEYIRGMEDGYINHMDELARGALVALSNFFGKHKNPLSTFIEENARSLSTDLSVTREGKALMFNLSLAGHPFRQVVVQSHQMTQIAGVHPKYLATRLIPEATVLSMLDTYFTMGGSNKAMDQIFKIQLDRLGMTSAEAINMYNQWTKSGLGNISSNNLVRSNYEYIAKGHYRKRIEQSLPGKLIIGGFDWARRVGFEAGERAQLQATWLTERDVAIEAGLDMNKPDVAAIVTAKTRNFSYGFNKAGEPPWTQNGLALGLQFQAIGFKAVTLMTFNRILPPKQKATMFLWTSALFGIPGLGLAKYLLGDVTPDDPDLRELVEHGSETMILNYMISSMTGEESRIAFDNSLSPWNIHGAANILEVALTDTMGLWKVVPVASLLKDRGRVNNLFSSAAQLFTQPDDIADPVTIERVMMDFVSLPSGMSAMFKAIYAVRAGEVFNTMGDTKRAVKVSQAIALAFGFDSIDTARTFSAEARLRGVYKGMKEDIVEHYNSTKFRMNRAGNPLIDQTDVTIMMREAYRALGSNRLVFDTIKSLISRDRKKGDATFFKYVWNMATRGGDLDEIILAVKEFPSMPNDTKEELIKRLRDLQALKSDRDKQE